MTDPEFTNQMERAKKRVASMDKLDGWKPRDPGTIVAALECGLKRPDTGAQFDALVMLMDAHRE